MQLIREVAMQAVDTNVLVRILVTDDKQTEQVKLARQFAKKAKLVFVPQIVQVELVWVLQAAYGLEKTEIIPVLQHLQVNESFQLQNEHEFSAALQLYQSNNVDFSDGLIFVESKKENCDVVTFDKKFSRIPNVKHLAD
jgi:predicted nucleic-acid-binding protein